MKRREFLANLGVMLAAPLAAEAQPVGRIYRLGVLSSGGLPPPPEHLHLFKALRELGYVEGENLLVERRYAEGNIERLPTMARELVRLSVDVIVPVSVAVDAARDATKTIPIVMALAINPVGRGVVSSLARPGGNITGVAYSVGPEIVHKRLELLKEAVPHAVRFAALAAEDGGGGRQAAQQAAAALGVRLIIVEVRAGEYERAFATMVTERVHALYVLGSPSLSTNRRRVIELAARHSLPAIYEWPEHAQEGGLMAYGASRLDVYGRVAGVVDRIFKGANPATIPIEQPAVWELAVNLRTAKMLRLTIPPSLLLRADQVIE